VKRKSYDLGDIAYFVSRTRDILLLLIGYILGLALAFVLARWLF
jgi:hypothetical protein